jgi:predicted kinase
MDGNRPICHIIRGLPGAGKSTRAARLGCLVISPQDMYATRGGVYRFREGQDVEAVGWATKVALHAMRAGVDMAIAEVLPRREDVAYWSSLARRHGYDVRVTDLDITPALSDRRNVHDVPRGVIDAMAEAWESWDVETEVVA